MSRDYPVKQFRNTVISADIDTLNTATAASNSGTIARFAAAGLISSRIFDPGTATGPERVVPAVGAAAAGRGWRENPAQVTGPAEPFTVEAGTWTVTLRVRRSGQTLEVDQNSDTTVIAYRVSSAGSFLSEIGRATVRFTWTTAATDRAFTFSPGAFAFAADDRIQLEVYVVTLTAVNVQAAPTVATDLILQVNAATDSRLDIPNYFIRYSRTPADSAPGTDTLARSGVFARTLADAAPGADAVTRVYRASRSTAEAAPAADTLVRSGRFTRAAADAAAATDVVARSGGRFSRSTSDSAPATDTLARSGVFTRQATDAAPATDAVTRTFVAFRNVADSAPATDSVARSGVFTRTLADAAAATDAASRSVNFVRQVTEVLTSGGGGDTIIVKKIINIFDD